MPLKTPLIFFCCLTITGQEMVAQQKLSKINVERQIKGDFSFAKHWAYPWEVLKDGRTGKFSKTNDEPLTAADTAHLYFTANCSTNVQGGYAIRYCFANKTGNTIKLTFSDGMPAYASTFYVYITGDSFYLRPKTIYPVRTAGQKITCEVTKQSLTLNKSSYQPHNTIMGYINAEFIETVTVPGKAAQSRTYYLKGAIRTPLN